MPANGNAKNLARDWMYPSELVFSSSLPQRAFPCEARKLARVIAQLESFDHPDHETSAGEGAFRWEVANMALTVLAMTHKALAAEVLAWVVIDQRRNVKQADSWFMAICKEADKLSEPVMHQRVG